MAEVFLGVNIDHIATVRNARGTQYPSLIYAALIAEQAGANGITVHLREDRRHIIDNDVKLLRQVLETKMNLEIAITDEMIDFACQIKPQFCCLVPEKRKELTTEGGLNVIEQQKLIRLAIKRLSEAGVIVSLFINPENDQIDAASDVGATFVEIHTGAYANANNEFQLEREFYRIKQAIKYATKTNLKINAGHGLTYNNVKRIAQLPEIYELNIGHSIIGRAFFSGMATAVSDMKKILYEARC